MPSDLENKYPTTPQERQNYQPVSIQPLGGIDTIISKPLEEAGQHILRVEVSYGGQDHRLSNPILNEDGTNPNPRKMLRKFYRFHVSSPLHIRELTLRGGESTCIVSIAVENAASTDNESGNASASASSGGGLTISQNEFQPYRGLIAKRIQPPSTKPNSQKSAVELFDESGRLNPGESRRYMFEVKAASEDANIRGIARGDELGKAIVTWHKAMGEAGRIASTYVFCPPSAVEDNKENHMNRPGSDKQLAEEGPEQDRFVVQGSGLSVDVAASAADRSASSSISHETQMQAIPLDDRFPVTVEPVNPPKRMTVGVPVDIQVLIVNHGTKTMDLQLQMRLSLMKGVVVYGQSFKNLGEIPPNGGSVVSKIKLIAMVPGLFFVGGCYVVDLASGMEIKQPNLLSVFVETNGTALDALTS